ncbi:MAG: extracellular solute-binding protein [Spirochaetota bacterium]
MRSLARTALVAAFCILSLFGATAQGAVKLVMWGGVPPEAGPQAVCDAFNKEFAAKGMSIEYERFVNDDQGNMKLDTNLLSGGDIDLYMTYTPDFLKKRASGNMALDLSKLIARDKFDPVQNFGPMASGYYIDGKPYSLPTKIDQYGIVVNKTMFDAAGIAIPSSWTMDEFAAVAKKLTKGEGDSKVYGMFFNSQQDVTYPMQYFVTQVLGGDPYYKAGGKETNFTDPSIVKTYKVIAKMMLVDKSAPSNVDSVTQKLSQEGMFLSGKSAMTIGSWIVRSIKNTEAYPHDFMTAFAPFPTPERRKDMFAQGGLGDHLCINPKSRNVEAAWTFAKWYSTRGMLPVVAGGRVPSYVKFDKDAILGSFLAGSEKLLDRASTKFVLIDPKDKYAVPSITTKLPEIRKVAIEEIEAILMGAKTPEQAMAEAKKRADVFLK